MNANKHSLAAVLFMAAIAAAPAHATTADEAEAVAFPRPYELLDIMQKFQRFADKLYFAGSAKNPDLTRWYLWKLEQAALDVTEHRTAPWYPPHVNEADLITNMLIPSIEDMRENLTAGNWATFKADYEAIVTACNGCHQVTEHDYVKIIVPKKPTYGNQDFNPTPKSKPE